MLAPVTPARLQANGRAFSHIAQFHPELTALRRDLHAHPELGFEEVYTSARVQEALRLCGVDEVHSGIGRTGVVGVVRGRTNSAGRMIGLRADMDALTMTEQNEFPWRSLKNGMMHGCGHDGHTAMLVGAARYLADNGYVTLSGEEYFQVLMGVRTPPDRAVLLTFDDGRGSLWSVGYPLMRRLGMKGIVFLVPARIPTTRSGLSATWDDVEAGRASADAVLSRESGDGSEFTVDLRLAGVAPRTADLVGRALRAVVGVRQVMAVVEPEGAD